MRQLSATTGNYRQLPEEMKANDYFSCFFILIATTFNKKKKKIMATRNGKFLRGVLGTFVYKVVNGKQIVSVRPLKGSTILSENTKKTNATFGMAASLGCAIRKSLITPLSDFPDGDMPKRLMSSLFKSLKNCLNKDTMVYQIEEDTFLNAEGFEFFSRSRFHALMRNEPKVTRTDGLLTVTVPKSLIVEKFEFPTSAFQCKIIINVSLFRLWDGLMAKVPDSQEIIFRRSMGYLEEQQLNFAVPNGCLCIVSVFLKYANYDTDKWVAVNEAKFNPGIITKAYMTSGTYEGNDDRIWVDMVKFTRPETE